MNRWILAFSFIFLTGCVAAPEAKQASGEADVALKQLRNATGAFEDGLVQELDTVQQLIESAILSRAVNRRVAEITKEGFDGNLIDLSKSIREARNLAAGRIEKIEGKTPQGPEPDYKAFVDETLRKVVLDMRYVAESIAEANPDGAARIREEADRTEAAVADDYEVGALADMVRLERMKLSVTADLKDLDDIVRLLQLMHADVNAWIATDVTVDGAMVGEVLRRNESLIARGDGS